MKKIFGLLGFYMVLVATIFLQPNEIAKAATKGNPYVLQTNQYAGIYNISLLTTKTIEKQGYASNDVEFTGEIKNKFEHHIYCYQIYNTGYYEFATSPLPGSYNPTTRSSEGLYDTMGAVYKVVNGSTKLVASGNDGNLRYFKGENGRKSCSIIVYLEKGDKVFFCIRGYNEMTGRYTVHMKMNTDTTKTAEHTDEVVVMSWKPDYVVVTYDYENYKLKKIADAKKDLNDYTSVVYYLNKQAVGAKIILLEKGGSVKYSGKQYDVLKLEKMAEDGQVEKVFTILGEGLGIAFEFGTIQGLAVDALMSFLESIVKIVAPTREAKASQLMKKCDVELILQGNSLKYEAHKGLYEKHYEYTGGLDGTYINETVCTQYDNNGNVVLDGAALQKGKWYFE